MLLDFTFSNYKSVHEKITLSMERDTRLREDDIDATNVIKNEGGGDVLKSAVIYGPNAAGKTNIVKAMQFMKDFVINSVREGQAGDEIPVYPFAFVQKRQPASMFEIRFSQEGREYRYGFELTTEKVMGEWLYVDEKECFVRDENEFHLTNFSEGKDLQDKTRPNALFISVCAGFNGKISQQLIRYFNQLEILLTLKFHVETTFENTYIDRLIALVKVADTGVSRIKKDAIPEIIVEDNVSRLEKHLSSIQFPCIPDLKDQVQKALEAKYAKVFTEHIVDGEKYELPFDVTSAGTQRLIDLADLFFQAIDGNKTLFIDEFDARLHPLLARELIRYFHRESKQAQLILTTHDVTLLKGDVKRLGKRLFRRDQVWFTEKNHDQATRLYSLSEFKKEDGTPVRQDESYEKKYLEGRYGGVPVLEDFAELTRDLTGSAAEP
jgi:AAA15 family ATPase/GTPase